MIKRQLGKTGINVSEIAFGGVEIGMPYGIGIKNQEDMLPFHEATNLLQEALDTGINFFDTARMYGESERIMGEAFKNRRNEVVIATKCRHFLDKNGNLPPSKELKTIITSSLHESLDALRSDYVDIFMLHQANTAILNHEDIAITFENLKKEGKIRATGASTHAFEETALAIDRGIWDVIQLPFNLVDQRQKDLFPIAYGKGIGLVIRSVLLKGLLSDRGKNLHPALAGVEEHIARYDSLLKNETYPLPTLAVKYVLSFPEVSAALVGIDSLSYLYQSIDAADGRYLDENKLQQASELAYPDSSFIDLPYWSKMNWLK